MPVLGGGGPGGGCAGGVAACSKFSLRDVKAADGSTAFKMSLNGFPVSAADLAASVAAMINC